MASRPARARMMDMYIIIIMYIKNEAFFKNTQLCRETSQVDKTENGKLPAVKGKPACARLNVHRLHLVGLEIATFGAPFADMCIYGVGTSKQSVRTCDSLCAKMTVGIGNQVSD